MALQRRWAAFVCGIVCSMLLAYSLIAKGGVGGRPSGQQQRGGNTSVGAMRPSAGANAPRQMGGQQNFNSMAASRPNSNSAGMGNPRGGVTGMPSGALRSNNAFAARPDLGMQRGGIPAKTFQSDLAKTRQQPPIATRPPINAQTKQFNGANLAAANRQGGGGLSGLGGATQVGNRRPAGLAPIMYPGGLTPPAGSNLAANQSANPPSWKSSRGSITGAGSAAKLAGWNAGGGPSVLRGRPDLGGATSNRPDTVFKPDISNPDRPRPGNLPANRPGFNRPDWDNRPGRPEWQNRPDGNFDRNNNWNSGNRNWNSNNNNWNVNNRWVSNRQNLYNNSPTIINSGYRPGYAMPGYGYGYRGNWGYGQQGVYDNSWQCGPGWAPAYGALHDNWCHGSWSGYGGDASWLNSAATGAAAGWLTNWMYGSRQYDWGYSSYSNPYYSADTQTTVYNYSQPINTETPPPAQDQVTTATMTLDQARAAFTSGDYSQALSQANQVVASLPNDPTVHQFRALALFALGRYDEASQTLYPVLSVGPGWDWTTMSGLYSSEELYERQLSTLENYVKGHPDMASARFLLAYHYLTIGSPDAAAEQLRWVVKLKPTDGLSRQMLALLDSAKKPATVASSTPPQTSSQVNMQPLPSNTSSVTEVPPAALVGTWNAKPDDKTAIKLTLGSDGKFTWDVNQQSGQNQLRGNFQIASGDLLTLAQDQQGGTLAGNVKLADDGRFIFRLMGAPESDPGLTFVRQL